MKIGLNATCFNERPSGAKQRFLGLYLPTMRNMPYCQFVVYSANDINMRNWFDDLDNVSIRNTPIPSEGRCNRIVSGLAYWPITLRKDSLDILEGFHLPPVSNPGGRMAMTVHDLRGFYPHVRYSHRALYRSVLEYGIRRSDQILTVSDAMKQEIHCVYPNAHVTRIYNGIDVGLFGRIDDDLANQFMFRRGIPADFLFAVGHYESRKNYIRLLEAIILLKEQGVCIPLVIAGNDSGQFAELKQRVSKAGLDKQVLLLRNLNDEQISWLYRKCRLFIFPSSYEGFGIPLLEAMAAEKPFLLSDIAVFRELSEGQGIYFSFDDSADMACKIQMLAESEDEQKRLVDYGRQRVTTFNFESLSRELISFYRTLV
jgi:glycosyltransferase involved in cell wall biosynthesis